MLISQSPEKYPHQYARMNYGGQANWESQTIKKDGADELVDLEPNLDNRG